MSDYDPKSIPILDDIIEDEIDSESVNTADTENKKTIPEEISADIIDSEDGRDDNTLDLFSDGITDIEVGTAEPEIAAIDISIDDLDDEPENNESALIDYQAVDIAADDNHAADDAVTQLPATVDLADVSTPSASLNAIVDDVVKQLIPDLEQQLHFLVQQALEEKLPVEIIQKLSSDTAAKSDD